MISFAEPLADTRAHLPSPHPDPSEDAHAASLWRRLATAWAELPEADEVGDSPLLDGISALIDEWQAFVGDGTGGRS